MTMYDTDSNRKLPVDQLSHNTPLEQHTYRKAITRKSLFLLNNMQFCLS